MMDKVKFWILAGGAFLIMVALALVGFDKPKTKPEAGSPEQMAKARKALEKKRADRRRFNELMAKDELDDLEENELDELIEKLDIKLENGKIKTNNDSGQPGEEKA